jgi:hypothetical protein
MNCEESIMRSNVVTLFDEAPTPKASAKRFEEFWKVYPKRVDKPLAKAKYVAIVTTGLDTKTLDKDSGSFIPIRLEATEEEIIAGAKRYLDSQIDKKTYRMKDDGKFLLHPSTWLNKGRWMDES